jgi:hypothetical protein
MRVDRRLRPFWLALILVATLSSPDPGVEVLLPERVAELTRPKPAYAVLPYIEQDNLRDPRIATQFRGINSPLGLSADGRFIVVTGHLRCNPDPPGEVSTIQVLIVQSTTGAVGQGQTQAACTGARTPWTAQLVAVGPATFLPGSALACALAVGATPIRRVQWCRDGGVTLVPIGPPPGPPPVPPVLVPVVMPLLVPMPVPLLPPPWPTSEPVMVAPPELPPSPAGLPAPRNDTLEGAGPPGTPATP